MYPTSPLDKIIGAADNALRTLLGGYQVTGRADPSANTAEAELTEQERKHAAG